MDLVDTLYKAYMRYHVFGYVTGGIVSSVIWDTVIREVMIVNKFLICGLIVHYSAEAFLYYNIDKLHAPLSLVFDKYYN